ncbi:NAD(P)H-dependent oxidoreductase [Chthonobacter albigriseus]|uniref:NAD(P)H-dependent oxidoreductase n=1 Tax=Chthonobacter albigriseus TaxID=1683161 RepID=UPI0015EEC93A|nr:NAD(P)H-dependent oxidoreductase [Chthonobacter albigriseus]
MPRRILIIQGHPDRDPARYGRALADAYANGAQAAGHDVRRLDLAELALPPLASVADWNSAPTPAVKAAQEAILAAEHLVFFYPLWLGAMPALMKAFLEQVCRPGFAFPQKRDGLGLGLLKGRSSRTVVTMGMPRLFYVVWYRALTLRAFERNILTFIGVKPNRHTIIGNVEGMTPVARAGWLERMRALGAAAR